MNDFIDPIDELTTLTLEREGVVSMIQAQLAQIPDRLDDVYGRIPQPDHLNQRLDELFPRLIKLNVRTKKSLWKKLFRK
mgnify:CR=1 FL=1